MQRKYNIHKTMVSGYGMLQAGLTIQTSLLQDAEWTSRIQSRNGTGGNPTQQKVGTVDIHWIPQYMSMSATEPGSIDTSYQIIGRSFVDTRHNQLPPKWKVNFLGARTTYPLVSLYSRLELRFAQFENVPLKAALASLVQMMTSPQLVGDDYAHDFMHDVVSCFLRQHMHVNDRKDSNMNEFFAMKKPGTRGPAIAYGKSPDARFAWFVSIPQHTPVDATMVVLPGPDLAVVAPTPPLQPQDQDQDQGAGVGVGP